MAFTPNDDYRRALEALTVPQVWEAAWRDGLVRVPPPAGPGLCASPFRDDGTRESFSVVGDGRGWKDHGGTGDKGGIKKFAEKCWPNLTPREMADKLITLSGIVRTPPPSPRVPTAAVPGATPAATPVDPAVAAAAAAIAKKRRLADMEDAVYAAREKAVRPPDIRWAQIWPACVRERFEEGLDALRADRKRQEELAAERGWPVAWVEQLADYGLVGYPYERKATPGAKWARRQKAFVVQQPRLTGTGVELVPIGYHQRFFEPARDGRPEMKGWLYLPSVPKFKPQSAYEEALLAYGKTVGSEPPRPTALVPPAPFVLGDLERPRLIVLLEGQWDAITFYGACGWLHDSTPAEGVAVFGIRGAQGMDAFLGLWAPWLRKHRPRAWLLADNDAAGGTWREAPPAEPGLPRPPSIGERLKLQGEGCREPVVSWLKPGPHGKDFNDYFKARGGAAAITPRVMYDWMRKLGLLDRAGGVAA